MKVVSTKKGKYEQVAEILDKQGYILDDQTFKIFGETGLWKVHEHIRVWNKLHSDREFFKDKKIVEKKKGYRCHLVRIDSTPYVAGGDNQFYKVGKEFFKEIEI